MTRLTPLQDDGSGGFDGAAALLAAAEVLDAAGDTLRDLDPTQWQSPAQRAFLDTLRLQLPVVSSAVRRFRGAATVLTDYASAAAQAHRWSVSAADRFAEADDTIELLRVQLANATDPVELERLSVLTDAWLATWREALASYHRIESDWRDRDAAFAARLRELAADEIADSTPYRVVHRARDIGNAVAPVGMVPTPLTKAIGGVGGLLAAGADVTLKVGYDEGSWGQIGSDLAWALLGRVASTLKNGAVIGAPIRGIGPAEDLSVAQRFVRGGMKTLDDRPVVQGLKGFPQAKAASAAKRAAAAERAATASPINPSLSGRMRQIATDQLDRTVTKVRYATVDAWLAASINGPAARRMLVSGWSLQAAVKTEGKVQSWHARQQNAVDR